MLDRLGLVRTTLLDYPGRVAATVFTAGCPLRCPYCHNPDLVPATPPPTFIPREEVLAFLAGRVGRIEGVCITGGEPLLHRDLPELVGSIAALGLSVKLDTCGMHPKRLAALLATGMVDLVAIDIKTAPEHYRRVGGSGRRLVESLEVLRASGVPYLCRTTAAPGVVDGPDIPAIGSLLLRGERHEIGQYRPGNTLDDRYRALAPHPRDVLEEWREMFVGLGIRCTLRGV